MMALCYPGLRACTLILFGAFCLLSFPAEFVLQKTRKRIIRPRIDTKA